MLCSSDIVVETVRIPAGHGSLEGELAYPEEAYPAGLAVLAGPHPLLGGSRNNNVVRGLADGLARCGLATLRFDYGALGGTADLAEFWRNSQVPDERALVHDLRAVAFLAAGTGPGLPVR